MSDALTFALKKGGKIFLQAKGEPAKVIIYAAVAVVVVAGYVVYYALSEEETKEGDG